MVLLGLVLASVFLLGGPHDLLHHQNGADCALCHLHVTEPPAPVQVAMPGLCVAHLEDPLGEPLADDREWSASAPRAPPAHV